MSRFDTYVDRAKVKLHPVITDNGGGIEFQTGDKKTVLERYAVWGNAGRGKHEVLEVSNDLEALQKKYHIEGEEVIKEPK